MSNDTQMDAYLERIVKKNTVPGSLLFTGERLDEIALVAKKFASSMASPADIHEYFPEGKVGMHSMETMRQFSAEVYLDPFNSERKVFIIHDAGRMLPSSANALLKTFEEPAGRSIIILTTKMPSSLLPTILSRCIVIRFRGREEAVYSEPILKILARGSFKTYQELKEAAASIDKKEEAAEGDAMELFRESQSIFNSILSWYRDAHLLQVGGNPSYLMHPEFIEELQRAKVLPLEKVQKVLSNAKLSLERFTSLTMVLERVFLELDYL